MISNITLAVLVILSISGIFLVAQPKTNVEQNKNEEDLTYKVTKEGATEQAFNNEYWDEKHPGIYVDANTGEPLFSSQDKYDSGSGWPSFTKPIQDADIKEVTDTKLGMKRTEVRTEESHLGHVFDDGPKEEGGQRFCINSAALKFIPYEDLESKGYAEYKELFPYEEAVLAGGCFWGVEHLLEETPGVISAISGYTGGTTENPTYKQVSSGKTGHAEAVHIVFDPSIITYPQLLDIFWRLHDPTQVDRQGPDRGTQYRSAIFYMNDNQKQIAEQSKAAFNAKKIFDKPAATEIIKFKKFYPAEDYHQNYVDKNPTYVCHTLREE